MLADPLNVSPQEFAQLLTEQAEKMIGTSDMLTQCFFVVREDGAVGIIATPWTSNEEKYTSLDFVSNFVRTQNVKRYAFVGEIWVGNPHSNLPPSEQTDRQEGVMVLVVDADGDHFCQINPIVRGDDGVKFGAPNLPDEGTFSGRMMNFFNEECETPTNVEMMRVDTGDRRRLH